MLVIINQASAERTVQELTTRRGVTADALTSFQDQQACMSGIGALWEEAVVGVLLAEPGPARDAAVDRLATVRLELRQAHQRCIAAHPLPDPTTTTTET